MDDCQVEYKKIMAAIDLSKYSESTFMHALALSKALDAELVLYNVFNTRYLDTVERYGGEAIGLNREDMIKRALDERRQEIEKDFLPKAQGGKVSLQFGEGLPWEQILNAVKREKVDMLVVGSKGRSDVAGVLFGSVAEKVQRHAACSVLTVRGPEHCRMPD